VRFLKSEVLGIRVTSGGRRAPHGTGRLLDGPDPACVERQGSGPDGRGGGGTADPRDGRGGAEGLAAPPGEGLHRGGHVPLPDRKADIRLHGKGDSKTPTAQGRSTKISSRCG